MNNQYYGVAWNYEDDSYALTGSLIGATPENIDEQMFVHNAISLNSIETSSGCYKLPKVYERRFQVGTAFIIEVALSPLIGFSLCPAMNVVRLLYLMEYGIWKALKQPATMKFNELKDGEELHDALPGTPIQKPLKQPIDGVYVLPSVYDEKKVVGYYVDPYRWHKP